MSARASVGSAGARASVGGGAGLVLQRACSCGGASGPGGDCEECRKKRLSVQRSPVAGGLEVGPPDDHYEREAERVAAAVVSASAPQPVSHSAAPQPEALPGLPTATVGPTPPAAGQVRKCTACEAEEKVQRKAGDSHAGRSTAPPIVRNVLQSPGQPLDAATRAFMEPRFMHDFSRVRVHSDALASRSADAVGARAYTVATDIAFRQGEYSPRTTVGERLLAHELTHVIQQSTGQPQGPMTRPTLMRSPLDAEEPVPAAPPAGTVTSPARVNAPSSPGWQSVDPQYILIKAGEPVELPHFLKLNYQDDKCDAGKTRWRVREGRYEDDDVCISTGALMAASSVSVGAAATAKHDLGKGQFWYGGTGPIDATTDSKNPVPKGTHDMEIPDFHHSLGAKYGDYATTWFRLGHSGDRYLHPGRVSLGCSTITAISEWPKIWKYLISSRKDHQNVGELEVV